MAGAPLTVVAAAVLLECHTLVVSEPGAAKNDLMAAALLLAAIAILVNWKSLLARALGDWRGHTCPLAVAGLATGLAVGTKSTALAMAAMLTLAVIVLAPAGRRWAAAGWWFAAGLAGGGYWYLRNLIVTGNPLPQLEHLGPISLPHPERLQEGRPDFSIAHYATDTGIWRDYFEPGLHQAFGALWPVVLLAALAGALVAIVWGRPKVLRWMGAVALVGMVAYVFTPLSAAGADGAPTGFGINIRYAIPALLAGLTLLPVAFLALRTSRAISVPPTTDPRETAWSLWDWCLLGGLLAALGRATNRSDAALRDPDRLFGWLVALLAVLIPAALLFARRRGAPRGAVVAGFAALGLAVLAIGYPVQRDYLRDRFANADPATSIPGMHLDSAYRWARDVHDARIGLVGTTAGFLEYGFYGDRPLQPRPLPRRQGPARRLRRDPDLRRLPRRGQRCRTSTTSSPRRSSTSSNPATRSPRPRHAGCAASPRRRRSSAAARSPSGASTAASTPPPAAPPTPRSAKSPQPPLD